LGGAEMKILGVTPRSAKPAVSKAVAFVGDVVGSVAKTLADGFNRLHGSNQSQKYSHIQDGNNQTFDSDGMGCKYCSASIQQGDTCPACEERVNPQSKTIGFKKPVESSGEPSMLSAYSMKMR